MTRYDIALGKPTPVDERFRFTAELPEYHSGCFDGQFTFTAEVGSDISEVLKAWWSKKLEVSNGSV